MAAAAILLSVTLSQIGVSNAAAAGPAGSAGPSVLENVNQDALSTFRSWMIGRPGFARSGYVGSVDDLAHRATTILWAGPRTALLSAILREGRQRGIAVSVQHRAHSMAQLNAAVNEIWRQSAAGGWAGFHVSAIAMVGATGNGLTVYGTYTALPAVQRAAVVRSRTTSVMGVPVQVTPGVATATADGRDADFASFNAGGYMTSPSTDGVCSTGFSISVNGVPRTTTARHCTANDYVARQAAGNSYGTGVTNSGDGGGRVLSAGGEADVFVGAFDSDTVDPVVAFEDLAVNDFVCTDGGNSGQHCNIKVVNLSVSFNDGVGAPFSTIEAVQQTAGAIAMIQGDSGGPVITSVGGHPTEMKAAGMMQGLTLTGMTGAAACGPAFDYGPSTDLNQCSPTVFFSSMRTIVGSISGAQLLTTS